MDSTSLLCSPLPASEVPAVIVCNTDMHTFSFDVFVHMYTSCKQLCWAPVRQAMNNLGNTGRKKKNKNPKTSQGCMSWLSVWLLFRAWIHHWLLEVGRITHKGMDKLCLTRVVFSELWSILRPTAQNNHSRKESWLVEVQGGSWEVVSLFWEISAGTNRKFYCLPQSSLQGKISLLRTLRQVGVAKFPEHSQGCPPRRVVSPAQTPTC